MHRRLLNIAYIVCLVACVALMGMWVRSYYWRDSIAWVFADATVLDVGSGFGSAAIGRWKSVGMDGVSPGIDAVSQDINDQDRRDVEAAADQPSQDELRFLGIRISTGPDSQYVSADYRFLVLATGLLAMLCRLRWPPRFTLRGLFIATTFLAVVLGMSAWLDRSWIGS